MTAHLSLVLNNAETILFFLLLLFLPTQLGKHFWPPFAFIHGQQVDYLAPTLYCTDLLIIVLFILWVFRGFTESGIKKIKIHDSRMYLLLLAFCFINTFFSINLTLTLYGFLKFSEMIFLTYYTSKILRKRPEIIIFPFIFGIIFESILAIAQFFNQGSLNGMFYFLGERTFTSVTPGIANASINGELIMRPYGTFSHPNVLAGYLVIGMTIVLLGIMNHESRITNIFLFIGLIIGTTGLFFTLSRVAIVVWVAILIFILIKKLKKKFLASCFLLLALIIFVPFLLPRFTNLTLQDESVVMREKLMDAAMRMIIDHPFVGVGLHNFLVVLPFYEKNTGNVLSLQPVHNIFLLIGSETGLIGLWLMISGVIFLCLKSWKSFGSILLAEIVILGSFDHYFLTIQQGQLLLAVTLGIIMLRNSNS